MPSSKSTQRPLVPDAEAIEAADQDSSNIADNAQILAPVVWIIGKVQSGKSSIVQAITGSSAAEIGSGFKPCTRTAQVFDFPADVPIVRFLDTRGLGETSYDPTDDLKFAEARAHLLLVVMRAMDTNQTAVIDVVSEVRRRHPTWPIIVAQTCLHEGYAAGVGHLLPYPFDKVTADDGVDGAIPQDLGRCLRHQRSLLSKLRSRAPTLFVPIDLTQPNDGLTPADYGLDALADALVRAAPSAMRTALLALPAVAIDGRKRLAEPIIMGHAVTAAGSDIVPIAGAVAVSAVQARLLQRLGQIYGLSWDRRTLAEFAGALGAGVAARTLVGLGLRQLAKFIPVYGQTVATVTSAATSFAVTFALGKAAVHFLTRQQRGLDPQEGTAAAYQAALREALSMAKARQLSSADHPGAT